MKTSDLILYWAPRVICILAIMFVSMFAFDVFSPGLTIWQQLAGLFIHLIPSFILLALLIIAWKWEKTGGIILTIIGIAISVAVFMLNYNRNHSVGKSLMIIAIICFPFIVAGVLFIVSYYHGEKRKNLS